MEKKYWCISWYYLIPLVIALIALVMTGAGVMRNIEIQKMKELKDIRLSEVKQGMYVEGYITDVLGSMSKMPGENKWYPLCGTDAVTMENRYVIPLESLDKKYVVSTEKYDEKFITLIVKRKFTNAFDPYVGKEYTARPNHITGKVVKLSGELPYEQLGSIFGTTEKTEIEKRVSESYAVQVVDLKEEQLGLLKGICLLAADVLFFITFFLPINVFSIQEEPKFPFRKREERKNEAEA